MLIKTENLKKKFAGNHFFIILRLFEGFGNIPFTKSETMRDYYF